MTTDRTHYKGRLLSEHSIEVLRLRDLAQRLKDAQDAEKYGPVAVPTGTEEKPPTAPIYGPNDPRSRAAKTAITFPPAVQKVADVVSPPGSASRKVVSVLGAMSTVDPERDVAAELQQANPIEKVMMALPVGAPVGSLAGTAGKGVLRQLGQGVGRAIETGGAAAGIPKAAETVAARVKLSTESEAALRKLTPAQKPGQIKAIQESTVLSAEEKAARLKIIEEGPITKPAATEALGPAAKPALATEGVKTETEVDELRRYLNEQDFPTTERITPEERQAMSTLLAARRAKRLGQPEAPVGAVRTPRQVPESVVQGSKVAPTGAKAAAAQAPSPAAAVPPQAIQGNLPPMAQGPRQPNFAAGPRAVPGQGPHSMVPPTKPPPPGNLPPAPPSGEFPSGRRAPTLEEAAARASEPLPPVDNYRRLVESSRNPPSDSLGTKMREGAYRFLKGFADRNQLLTKMSTSEGVSVHDLAQVVPGATLDGGNVLRLKVQPVYEALGAKNIPYLQDYMVAMRDSDILARNPHAVLPGNVQGYQGVQEALAGIKAKVGDVEFARIQQAAEARWAVQQSEVLDYAVKQGLLSAKDAQAMSSAHPHYIPFMRTDWVETLDNAYAAGVKPEGSLSSLGIEQMALAGSTRNLDNPLARMDAQVIKMRRLVARNDTAKGIADSLEAMQKATGTPLIHYLEPASLRTNVNIAGGVKQPLGHLPTPEGTVPGTISFIKNGEHYIAEVPEEYAIVAKGLGEEAPDGVTRLAGMMNQPLKLGATGLNTFFIPVNAVRDMQSAYFNAGLVPFSKYYWQGVAASLFKNDLFNEAVGARALGGGFVESMRPASAISRAQSQFYGKLVVHSFQDALLAIPRSIERLNVNVERATRLGVYAKARGTGLTQLESAVRARNATADFSKAGTTMRIVNQYIPFSNAAVQGTAASVMRIKNKPWLAAAAAAPFLAMTALSRVNNMRFDSYNSIPNYVFNNNWVLQYGEVTHKDGTVYPVYVTVPKGQFMSAIVFPLEAMFNMARTTNDKTATKLFMEAGLGAAQNISPVSDVASVVPAPIQAGIEVAANKDFYTGQPIVSQSEQNLPKEQQFGPETSKTAIALGQIFGISPRLIDHAISATTGGVGQQVAWLAGLGLQALGFHPIPYGSELSKNIKEQSVSEQLGRTPGVKRFLGTRNTQEISVGWDNFNAAVAETNQRFSKIPTMNGLGIRLGSVGDSIDLAPGKTGGSRELTPQERAQYQTIMAQLVIPELTAFVDKMDMTLAPDDRRILIARQMEYLKKVASGSFIDVLTAPSAPSGTPSRRIRERSTATPTATPTPARRTIRERAPVGATP